MRRLLFLLVFLSGLNACKKITTVKYEYGLKKTDHFIMIPERSTSYFRIGKTVFTDSINGNKVKVIKYQERNHCYGSMNRTIMIEYDSTGRKIGRKNLNKVPPVKGKTVRVKFENEES